MHIITKNSDKIQQKHTLNCKKLTKKYLLNKNLQKTNKNQQKLIKIASNRHKIPNNFDKKYQKFIVIDILST